MDLQLSSSVQYVPRVGPAMAGKLERLGIRLVRDLLYYVPFRYNDFSRVLPVRSLRAGSSTSIKGEVVSIKNIFTKTGKKIQECLVKDQTGQATVIWFNQLYLPKIIHPGDAIALSGTVGFFGNKLIMESPEYELASPGKPFLHTGRIVPVYSETAGITSKWLRGRIYFLLTTLNILGSEYLPAELKNEYAALSIAEALHDIHFPKTLEDAERARKRLAFDELLIMQCTSFEQKRIWKETKHAAAIPSDANALRQFLSNLPFTLTADQEQALKEIHADINSETPMNRLLEGDVGSGKTVVATAAIYTAALHGFQSIFMAPTQILAEQHYQTVSTLLAPFHIPVSLIVGGTKNKKTAPSNDAQVLIGTHALIQEKIAFGKVGLIVIDEQQRFGVYQRSILRSKGGGGKTPHLLTMTATPIPRTLALTLYGNLSLSILRTMPENRKRIKTWVVPPEKRGQAYAWIEKEISKHQSQAFILCPFVEESESITSVRAATKEYETLKTSVFPKLTLGLIHGRMKAKDKTAALDAFRSGATHILVATPVVEVGIDIQNATVMMIEGADRFGLSQLHQLRGRVGRGDQQSYCLLFSDVANAKTTERLRLLETVHSGPDLAEYDLKLRGQGDVFGARQHGVPTFVLASLADDQLVGSVSSAVLKLTGIDQTFGAFPHLRERLNESKIQDIAQD